MADKSINIDMSTGTLEVNGFCDQITVQGINIKNPTHISVYDIMAKCIALLNSAEILTFDEASTATQRLLHKVETEVLNSTVKGK